MSFTVDDLVRRLRQFPRPERYLAAFSGGVDSSVLLHVLHVTRQHLGAPLGAVHVDHGLAPDSGDWAERCSAFCAVRDIPLEVLRLDLDCPRGESIEACAREARYRAMKSVLGPDDALLTAHHLDDQAETLLLHALRGCGVDGLSAIPEVRRFGPGWVMRPMLDLGRSDIEDFAREQGLEWVEDPANGDQRFDRNYLRQVVMPMLNRRWPAASRTLSRTASNCVEAAGLIAGLAADDLAAVADGDALVVSALAGLDPARQRAVLRLWLSGRGLPVPDRSRLTELQRQATRAAGDRQPMVAWSGAEVRRWRDRLYAFGPLPPFPDGVHLSWQSPAPLALPGDMGELHIEGAHPEGELEVRFREGGESCLHGGIHRPLKKLLQELGVPPWLRGRVPLLYLEDELVAVGTFFRCDAWPENAAIVWTRGRGWQSGGI